MNIWDPEFLRIANVVLSVAAVSVLIASSVLRLEVLTSNEKRVLPWLTVILLVIAYGSGEAAAQNAPIGYRVLLMALALAGFLGAMIFGLRDVSHRDGG